MKTSFKILNAIIVIFILLPIKTIASNPSLKDLKEYTANLPFTMPEIIELKFPDHRVSIVEHGAVADGITMNTQAFSGAISACVKLGGGTVVVPRGLWLTGPIKLESNINLYLERGALVQFSNRFEDFPLIAGFDGKSKKYQVTPPIYAFRAKNIAVTGEGVIDGAGEAWRYVKKEKLTTNQWKELISSRGVVSADGKQWWPSKEALEGEKYIDELEKSRKELTSADYAKAREFLRPDMIRLVQCNGILLDGPTFRNSPKFHVHPVQSENIIIRNIKIITPWYAQNGDGLDLNSCRNVVVYKIMVDVGDDAICIKPGKIGKNQQPGPACENIVIADCEVYHAHGGFVIGSESYGGARNISVRNCIFIGTDVGLRFKSQRGRGGLIENIFVDGIQMRDIQNEAILFDMNYGDKAIEELVATASELNKVEPVTSETPIFQNFYISNVICNGAKSAVSLNGLPEMPLKNIHITDTYITSNKGIFCTNSDSIYIINSNFVSKNSPLISLNQSTNISLNKINYLHEIDLFLKVEGERSRNITLQNIDFNNAKKDVEFGKSVNADAVVRK
jgi:DNA sulfur modification protein DndE